MFILAFIGKITNYRNYFNRYTSNMMSRSYSFTKMIFCQKRTAGRNYELMRTKKEIKF